jgi:hypothetical protein
MREQQGGTSSAMGVVRSRWLAPVEGDGGEKRRWMNMVQTMYTHVFKCKNDTRETLLPHGYFFLFFFSFLFSFSSPSSIKQK